MKTKEKVIYLSFDDGPVPEMTVDVLGILKAYKAKATFFCVGENIQKYPQVFEKVVNEGHRVGNHSFNHLNGIQSDTKSYVSNIWKCHDMLGDAVGKPLFRPPYGRLTNKQEQILHKNFDVVMWSVLAGILMTSSTRNAA